MDRFEKIEWLRETCTEEFTKEILVNEMARWMGEDDFNEFYSHLCGCWDIAEGAEELNALMNE
jgi:hypothetical protein